MIADTEMIWKQIPTYMNIRNMAKYAAFWKGIHCSLHSLFQQSPLLKTKSVFLLFVGGCLEICAFFRCCMPCNPIKQHEIMLFSYTNLCLQVQKSTSNLKCLLTKCSCILQFNCSLFKKSTSMTGFDRK